MEKTAFSSDEDSWENSRDAVEKQETIQKSPAEEANSLRIESSGGGSNFDGMDNYLEETVSEEITLRDHIFDQITVDFNDPAKQLIAAHMFDMMDSSGYISEDLSGLKEQLDCDDALIEEVLCRLQQCDPPGLFARSLAECLELQLRDKDRFDPAMEKLVQNLDLIAKGEFKKLQKICGVDEEDIQDMCAEIRALNPKPASEFNHEAAQAVQADIFLRKNDDGAWALELNQDTLPKLLVNKTYYAEVKKKAKNDYEKDYLTDQLNSANWLLKTLNQRAETILKVATELVAQQNDFFERGIYYLKPMVLHDIAEKIEMHESTVGRVTNNKYIATPRGLFELKYFFSSSLHSSSASHSDFSSKTVKHLIQELVEAESLKKGVYSDDKIAEILQGKGIDIARRTVAKYREAMKIPSSAQRKRNLKIQTRN